MPQNDCGGRDGSQSIFSLAFFGALGWWIWTANRTKAPDKPTEVVYLSTRKVPVVDPFLANIESERISVEQQTSDEITKYTETVEAQVKDDEALKARLSKFAKDNKLDVALAQLWDEMRSYPAWSIRADFEELNKLKVTEIGESEFKDFDNKVIWFTYNSVKYTIKTRRWSGMESELYQDFTLIENNEEVFVISTEMVDDYVTRYKPWLIRAFKRKGQWATMLIKLMAKLELENEKSSADRRALAAIDKAAFTALEGASFGHFICAI